MPPTLLGTEHHPHARAVLGAALEGQPSHAYLFHGPSGTGKRAVAEAFATALLETDAVRVEHRAHPDLMWVAPSGAHELLVDDVKPVVSAAARTPFESQRRVFVLERADTMNDEAANRMLKTLEEPPTFVHLVLLTDRPSDVLETIASRCQAVRFDPLPDDEVAARLEREHGVDARTATACARLAMGDAARAAALATGEGPRLREAAERLARAAPAGQMASKPWRDVLSMASQRGEGAVAALEEAHARDRELVAKRDRRRSETEHAERARRAQRRAYTETLDLALGLAGLWYRDVAATAWGAPELACHADRPGELAADAGTADPQRYRQAVELVEDTRQRLALNVNEELACEALGYRLERLLAAS